MFDSEFTESTELKNVNTNPYKRIYQSLYRKGLKNIDSETFGDAKSTLNPEDLNPDKNYDDVILYLRNEISRLRKFIGFDQIDTENEETGKYEIKANDYDFVFGYRKEDIDIGTDSPMTCLLDYIKQFANTVKVYEGILFPENSDIDFSDLDNIK